MAQWEYKVVHRMEGGIVASDDNPDERATVIRRGDLTSFLNQLGADGWEMTGVAGLSYDDYIMFLKRTRKE